MDVMGVIWFLLHVLKFLLIRFTQRNSCCISKSLGGRVTLLYLLGTRENTMRLFAKIYIF